MSDHLIRANFNCDWKSAFLLVSSAISLAGGQATHPTEGLQYFWPPDGSDRRKFDMQSDGKVDGGGVQFWFSVDCDVFVSWRKKETGIQFDIDQKGKNIDQQVDLLRFLYLSIRREGMSLVGDGSVLEVIFFESEA